LSAYFGDRVDPDVLFKRLAQEARLDTNLATPLPKKLTGFDFVVRVALYASLTRWWGQRNALDVQLVNHSLQVPELPSSLHGFRILQLSDLHIDANPGYAKALIDCIKGVDVDLTVITGDFRSRNYGTKETTLACMRDIAPHIPLLGERCFGILGNHDSIDLVPELEAMGIDVLMNESRQIPVGGQDIFIAGTDDPYTFRAADLERCVQGGQCPAGTFNIALIHTPQLAAQAAAAGFDIYLTGHTHGGQFCWPWGGAIDPTLGFSAEHMAGQWREGNMLGYTSRGSGTSIIDARFFCPPEVTVHTLVRTAS